MNPNAPYVWVGGFSFGAWIGMQLLMRRPEIRGFISVAPPANMYDFSFLAPCPTSGPDCSGRQGSDRSRTEPTEKLVQKLRTQRGISVDYRIIPDAGHFFKDHTEELVGHVHDHMNKAVSGGKAIRNSQIVVAA